MSEGVERKERKRECDCTFKATICLQCLFIAQGQLVLKRVKRKREGESQIEEMSVCVFERERKV